MTKRRVVITGIGVISPCGLNKDAFWNNIVQGRSGVSVVSGFDTSEFPVKVAAEIKDFKPELYIQDDKMLSRTTKFAQYGLAAAMEAIQDSALWNYDNERVGVVLGTIIGGVGYALEQHYNFIKGGFQSLDTFSTAIGVANSCAVAISMMLQAKGPTITISNSCSTSADAIGQSMNMIRRGEIDCAISGGTEAPMYPPIFASICLARILSQKNEEPIKIPCPFDIKRDGTVIGEGSVILVIEELNHALKRGANIYAEIMGYAATSDAYHIVNPAPDGTQGVRTLNSSLLDANICPEEVDYINAHGTGTVKNDKVETLIIKEVFKKHAYNLTVSSTKSMTGHMWGAAGAVEAAICAMSVKNNIVPPTINYENPDPECDLNYVPNKSIAKEVNVAVSNSFGLGGQNSVLVFRKYRG